MDFQSELHSISVELSSIIRELDDIRSELSASKFDGIDIGKCASVVGERTDKYRAAKTKLDAVDTTKVEDAVESAQEA